MNYAGMPMQKPALIIFDWDDTLVDNYAAIHAAINAARAHFAQPLWTLDEARLHCRRALTEIFPEWFGAEWPVAKKIFYEVFAAEHIRHLRIMPGAAALLQSLKASGVPLAVNSNKNKDYLQEEVAHLGWQDYFAVLVGAGVVPTGKPAPDGINHIRNLTGISSAATTWFVGDNDLDVQTARSGGCLPILLHQKTAMNLPSGDRVLLRNCEELLELFKAMT